MSEPFIAEIRIFAGNFAPRGWAFCNGQLLPVASNTALFALVGTTYGGDGRTTLGLPNLEGRAPMHPGRGPGLTARRLGQRGGATTDTITTNTMPTHSHQLVAAGNQAALKPPSSAVSVARTRFGQAFQQDSANNLVDMAPQAIGDTGGDQLHENMQPFLTLNFIIALVGTFPSRG